MRAAADELLFVYGTLRGNLPSDTGSIWHQRLIAPHADFIGPGSVAGRLFDLGDYPGLCPSPFARDRVQGEVWRLHNTSALQALDEYEGCAPYAPPPVEYVRLREPVRLTDGRRLTAWVYYYTGPVPPNSLVVSGDYCQSPVR